MVPVVSVIQGLHCIVRRYPVTNLFCQVSHCCFHALLIIITKIISFVLGFVWHIIARRVWHYTCTKPLNKGFEDERERERDALLLWTMLCNDRSFIVCMHLFLKSVWSPCMYPVHYYTCAPLISSSFAFNK